MEIEVCFICGEPTGRAGKCDDSMFDAFNDGPYCEDCWDERDVHIAARVQDKTNALKTRLAEAEKRAELAETAVTYLHGLASDVQDMLLNQGSPGIDCWKDLCVQTGRYVEPYLSFELLKRAETAESERDAYRAALIEIRDEPGKRWCCVEDLHSIADEALGGEDESEV